MNYFVVVNAQKIRQLFFVATAVLLSLTVIWVEKENLSVFAPPSPTAVYSVPTDRKVIALTFDISWGDKRAMPILDILAQKEVKDATFFLSSPWSKSHPDIVKRIVDAGYEVGSHGHKHDNYSTYSDEEIRRQISTAHGILTELTGKPPKLIRMPNGDFDKRVLQVADDLGYRVVQWDTDSLDWKNPGTNTIVQRVLTGAHPGDIVLLHASDSCLQTHEALPIIIDELRARGYEFASVSQLLGQAETRSKTVEDRSAWNLLT